MEFSTLLVAAVVFGVFMLFAALRRAAQNQRTGDGRATPGGGARPLGRGPVVSPPPLWQESFRRPEAMSVYGEEDAVPAMAVEQTPEAIETVTPTESAPFTPEELRRMVIAKEILERRVPGAPRRRF